MERIYARNCEVRKITNKEANTFLDTYHKQKGLMSASYCYGLFYKDELVQVETFGFPRIEKQNGTIWHDWELLRECSKKDYYILGGKSKLLKAFENEVHPLSLLSYCNTTAGFDGSSYAACGFHLDSTTKEYWYEYNGDKIQRYTMQKNSNLRKNGKIEPIQKTLEKYGKTYYPEKSEKENASLAGFVLVEGKGQQTWTKYYSENIGYVYLIVHKESGKVYVGKHILRQNGIEKDRDYWASGTHISAAVKKYGKRAFYRKPLYWTTDLVDLAEKECDFISEWEQKVGRENMYNIDFREKTASNGQWKFDEEKYKNAKLKQANHCRESMLKAWKEHPEYWENRNCSHIVTEEQKVAISERQKEYYKTHDGYWLGKNHSEETKDKISNTKREKAASMTPEERKEHFNPHHTEESKNKIKAARANQDMSYTQTEEYRQLFRGENNPMYGKKMSDESKEKMKATNDAKNIERRAKIKADGYLLSEERLPGVKYEVVYRLNNIRAYKKVE